MSGFLSSVWSVTKKALPYVASAAAGAVAVKAYDRFMANDDATPPSTVKKRGRPAKNPAAANKKPGKKSKPEVL
jgi:hypothetical protein